MRKAANRRATLSCRRGAAAAAAAAAMCALVFTAQAPLAAPADASGQSAADGPSEISVTVYRAPFRAKGSIDLDALQGFALISETRTVHLAAGTQRLRFEGVADGIEPSSAIVTGLPEGIVEKNREGKLLSPSTLIDAAVGGRVTLLRTDRKTGKTTRTAGTVRSDAGGGVVFETAEGIEALRCSGLTESLSFTGIDGLSATPTLSVLVRASSPLTQSVTLSYLARGFDWSADYVATLSADGKTMDLGAWVTLANGNGVGFPSARTQVVAGRVNRESGEVEPLDIGGPVIAQCWPQGTTSDIAEDWQFKRTLQFDAARDGAAKAVFAMAAAPRLEDVAVTATRRVEQEQLGDLKLYRVPDRTTVASRQSKQVRLLDRQAIPIEFVYGADLGAAATASTAASLLLRTSNTAANHLGLPLPSGRVAVFAARGAETLLRHESGIRDLAVDEEVEIDLGRSPDVQVTLQKEKTNIDPAHSGLPPPVPGVLTPHSVDSDDAYRVDVSNARPQPIRFELRLQLPEGARIVRADRPLAAKSGRPIFRLTIPANGSVAVRYQTHR